MENITLEDLKLQLDRIEKANVLAHKTMLTLNDAEIYTGLKGSTIMRAAKKKEISYCKHNSKTLFFNKKDLDAWICSNRIPSTAEIEMHAANYDFRRATGRR